MKQKTKSILGLNTVKAFIIVLLSLAIIAVVTLVVLGAIQNANIIASATGSATNEKTSSVIKDAPVNLGVLSLGYTNPVCSVSSVVNSTSNTPIGAVNYSLSSNGCAIAWLNTTSPTTGGLNNSYWNVTYSYTYNSAGQNGVNGIVGNTSSGMIAFFTNAGTYFSLLGVVVIILIISLVVVVVNRFGGENANTSATM
jgi:hypothetical protein